MRENWCARRSTNAPGWTVDDKGIAAPNKRDISTKQEFGDCYLHVEFCEPLIHQDEEFNGPTGIQYEQYKGEVPTGPIILQGDHDTVQFRNVWIVPAKY